MSKRLSKGNNGSSPAKRQRLESTKEPSASNGRNSNNGPANNFTQNDDDIWGDDFAVDDIEKMDFIASQATQEEAVFVQPKPMQPQELTKSTSSPLLYSSASTSSSGNNRAYRSNSVAARQKNSNGPDIEIQSQMLGSSSEVSKEIVELTQALMYDGFENDRVQNACMNSTFHNRQDVPKNNMVLVSDDDQIEMWKEEKKKMLEDFMTKEGETEFLRQQISQIQMRFENDKKEQARLLQEQDKRSKAEIEQLKRDRNAMETQLQYQIMQCKSISEKCKMMESGSVKFAQPQANIAKISKDRSNMSMTGTPKKIKTKEISIQVDKPVPKTLKTTSIQYPLKNMPKCIFEPPELEKSVVNIKIEEKIGKRNLAIIQEEDTFRIFENPELSKPKVTFVDGKKLSTEFFLPDLAILMHKTTDQINSPDVIPILNKLVATTRELLLNSSLVLDRIAAAEQNDDVRDMNELYLSEFYEMPVQHTRGLAEARPWYDLERGVETRRAMAVLAHVARVSGYLGDYVAGNVKLRTAGDREYERYARQMPSYEGWYKRGFDFEFLELVAEFVGVVGTIRRSHQFTGLINAIMTLLTNVQANVGFSPPGIKRIGTIFKEVIQSRPLLACFASISRGLNEFSQYSSFVNKLCVSPDKSGINIWKGSHSFTPDACTLEIFVTQLEHFKLDPITLINVTKDLGNFSCRALLSNSVPWLEKTMLTCNCCMSLLKFVVTNLSECSKIRVDGLRGRYATTNMAWRVSRQGDSGKKNKIVWKNELREDWPSLETEGKQDFWDSLRLAQLWGIAYGIRLLSFLAKRDLDFMIRSTDVEDAFHIFLNNLRKREDFVINDSDDIALDIVKKLFVLEKNIEENSQEKLNIAKLESERWTDRNSTPGATDFLVYENLV